MEINAAIFIKSVLFDTMLLFERCYFFPFVACVLACLVIVPFLSLHMCLHFFEIQLQAVSWWPAMSFYKAALMA